MEKPKHYSTYCALAAAVLYFAWDLSRNDRGLIDWAVMAFVASALLYNIFMLGRRLYAGGGGKALWHLLRTLVFWIVGLSGTLLLRPEDTGRWSPALGWLFIALAAADSVALHLKERTL